MHCRPDAGQEFLSGDDLFPHQMTATLSLDLVFNVQPRNSGLDILLHRSSDIRRSAETEAAFRAQS